VADPDAEKKLRLLIKFGGLISAETTVDALLEIIADQIRLIADADRCTVFLADMARNELWSKVAHGGHRREIRVAMGSGIAGICAVTGETINAGDAYSDPRFLPDIDKTTGYKTRNVLAVPLKNSKGELLGVFEALNKKSGAGFTQGDIGLLQLMGTLAANAIENAKLYEDLRATQEETIYRLAVTAEYRDQQDTGRHLRNIGRVTYQLALAMGLQREDAEDMRRASALHDIGKVALCDAILLKPGKLTAAEFEEMKKHTLYGARILSKAESRLLRIASRLAAAHHEKYDGSGYPGGLKGREIPLEARIVAVADVFDALCMPRVYKPAWGAKRAYDYIIRHAGRAFDPEVVEAFRSIFPEIKKIYADQPE